MSTRRPWRRDGSRGGSYAGTWRHWSRIARSEAKRTQDSITKRLAAVDEQLATADALTRLHLVQERVDLELELSAGGDDGAELEELEVAFIDVAADYGERKRLTYEAWRSVGVEPRVLKAAGKGRGQ